MKKANILVQYAGGGYDGCHWEWNFFLTDDLENPTVFENIFSSGRDGIESIDGISSLGTHLCRNEVYQYDLTTLEGWKEFDHEANPGHVLGVSKWLYEHRKDIFHLPCCDGCGAELEFEELYMGGYHGNGGIVIAPGSKTCEECDIREAWESWVRDEILRELRKRDIDFDSHSNEEVDQLLQEAIDCTGACWEGEGDDRHLYRWEDVVEYVEDNPGFVERTLSRVKQLELV